MSIRSKLRAAALVAAGLVLLSWPARAIFQNGGVSQHQHRSVNDGGPSIAPTTLVVSGVSTLAAIQSPGYYILVASADVAGVSSVSFTGLSSSTTYRMEWNVQAGASSGYLALSINTANTIPTNWPIHYAGRETDAAGTATTCGQKDHNFPLTVCGSALNLATNGGSSGILTIHPDSGNTGRTLFTASSSNEKLSGGVSTMTFVTIGGRYIGTALSSFTVSGLGAFTSGELYLYKRIQASGYTLPGASGFGSNMPIHQHSGTSDGGTYLTPSSMTVSGAVSASSITATNLVSASTISVTNTVTAARFVGDGSALTGVSGSGGVYVATFTYAPYADSTAFTGSAWQAVGGSTITLTTTGNKVNVVYNCTYGGSSAGFIDLRVIQDGALWQLPLGGTSGKHSAIAIVANQYVPFSINMISTTAPAAGSHTYSLQVKNETGGTLYGAPNTSQDACQFSVREVPW